MNVNAEGNKVTITLDLIEAKVLARELGDARFGGGTGHQIERLWTQLFEALG